MVAWIVSGIGALAFGAAVLRIGRWLRFDEDDLNASRARVNREQVQGEGHFGRPYTG